MTTPTQAPASAGHLSVRDHMVLQLWGRRWRHGAARDRAAEQLVGLRGTALVMRVATLSEDPVAIAAYPVITRRAREVRQTRERAVRAPAA
ncbi:DUF3263 domain-containing protein [Micrococcus luteus]|uniref:DUF3263 domain-containing protein n=1 Tax=Micrococcus luteus TaxID=1270 RepID=UPI000E030B5A|nr:DUF3263 domain-containing protein [Micrococcus luteus]STY69224.1 Protein of uncharacterised function (DUF3263) [Micrococcus luteus]